VEGRVVDDQQDFILVSGELDVLLRALELLMVAVLAQLIQLDPEAHSVRVHLEDFLELIDCVVDVVLDLVDEPVDAFGGGSAGDGLVGGGEDTRLDVLLGLVVHLEEVVVPEQIQREPIQRCLSELRMELHQILEVLAGGVEASVGVPGGVLVRHHVSRERRQAPQILLRLQRLQIRSRSAIEDSHFFIQFADCEHEGVDQGKVF